MTDGPDKTISGTFFVDINSDPSVQDMDFELSMGYSHSRNMNKTHVCRTNKMDNTGVYIYVSAPIPECQALLTTFFPDTKRPRF